MLNEIQNLIINGDALRVSEVRAFAKNPLEGFLPYPDHFGAQDRYNNFIYEFDVHQGLSSDNLVVQIGLRNWAEDDQPAVYDTDISVHNNDWATLRVQSDCISYAVRAFEKLFAHVHGIEI